MHEPRRQLYILKPEAPASLPPFEKLMKLNFDLNPLVADPKQLQGNVELDGNVLLIPSGPWRPGVLSELSRFADLSLIALLGEDEVRELVGLWYVLGASLVLDDTASPAILKAAIVKFLEVEVSTLRPQLTRKENMLFEVLRRAGKGGIDRSVLAERVWNDVTINKKTVDVHIFNLRRKLSSTRYAILTEVNRFTMVDVPAEAMSKAATNIVSKVAPKASSKN